MCRSMNNKSNPACICPNLIHFKLLRKNLSRISFFVAYDDVIVLKASGTKLYN
jgi:hypothetical protein